MIANSVRPALSDWTSSLLHESRTCPNSWMVSKRLELQLMIWISCFFDNVLSYRRSERSSNWNFVHFCRSLRFLWSFFWAWLWNRMSIGVFLNNNGRENIQFHGRLWDEKSKGYVLAVISSDFHQLPMTMMTYSTVKFDLSESSSWNEGNFTAEFSWRVDFISVVKKAFATKIISGSVGDPVTFLLSIPKQCSYYKQSCLIRFYWRNISFPLLLLGMHAKCPMWKKTK